jgi:hypothetical protein
MGFDPKLWDFPKFDPKLWELGILGYFRVKHPNFNEKIMVEIRVF